MAPRIHYARSQERVYKKVGRVYKLVPVDIPRQAIPSTSQKQNEPSPQLPPVVTAPSDGDATQSFPDTSFPADYDMPRSRKSRKVSI
jgi:hypothetical protein